MAVGAVGWQWELWGAVGWQWDLWGAVGWQHTLASRLVRVAAASTGCSPWASGAAWGSRAKLSPTAMGDSLSRNSDSFCGGGMRAELWGAAVSPQPPVGTPVHPAPQPGTPM